MLRRVLVGALLALAACPQPQQAHSDAVAPTAPVASGAASSARVEPPPLAPPVAAAGAVVSIRNVLPGTFEITSDSPSVRRLAIEGALERRASDGTWAEEKGLDLGKGYRLVEDCAATPPACIELGPHATLRPVPFKGYSCSSQCNGTCRHNVWEGPSTFRLTVRACGGASFAGPPFELPDALPEPAFARWGLATDVVRASAMRLDGPTAGWRGDEPASPGTVAGFAVHAGTERPLDAEATKALLELLRAPHGFDDDVMKRCLMKGLVGFTLVRAPQTTGAPREDVVEIAIDHVCNKLFAVRGGEAGSKRTMHATHFDPSRAGFLALTKRLGI